MDKDGSRVYDIQLHHRNVQGFDESIQTSWSYGKMKIQTSDGMKTLNNVWLLAPFPNRSSVYLNWFCS
jgi:hypothetical protein